MAALTEHDFVSNTPQGKIKKPEDNAAESDIPAKLFYAEGKVDAVGLPLISFDDGKLEVKEEGTRLLNGQGGDVPINLIFIFGNARSGKSFMMNCLTGVRGLFKVQNSSTPCTRGVDMSSHLAKWADLAKNVGVPIPAAPPPGPDPAKEKKSLKGNIGRMFKKVVGKNPTDFPRLGFVDVEGQGAEDGTYDTMLALPLLLTSRVVLFNHKGAPTVSDMLSKLGVLARAAEYIDVGEGEAEKTDDSPVGNGEHEEKKKFGHLHVLFRDFSFSGDSESVYNQLMNPEKVIKTLKPKSGMDPSAAAKERNDIRDLLLRNFLTINVWLFRQPGNPDDLKANHELPADKIDAEFQDTVKQLLKCIVEQTYDATRFHNSNLTGPKHVSLLKQITASLNEGGIISVPSVFAGMEKETLGRVTSICTTEFLKACAEIEAKLPMPDQDLTEKAGSVNDAMFERFENELADCSLSEEINVKRKELVATATRVITELQRKNGEATLGLVRKVVTKEVAKVRHFFDQYCTKNIPMEKTALLEEKFKFLKEQARAEIKKQLSVLPQTLELPEFQEVLLEQEEILQEFLTMMTLKNESMIKDQQIDKMHTEAIAQQERLIEQNKKLELLNAAEKKNTQTMMAELKLLEDQKTKSDARKQEVEDLLAKQNAELEKLRKARKRACVIL
eukprot:gb/GEZN01001923.1/.p1 GENE.gb/GEZN01001923.1/~~gb/GEZN01001923.1/.p1  ORF type:complete len:672 (+),score=109.52 gb/GEZN01001923.1/:59-2074(+)